ncbi:tripartite tricarboxylate transporter TctB family protein [Halostella sp. JP-L12]|uniref:tripartite tricarboxylate transporter TctB family protein n=1 Tax=Halostella TaxID=1843185 RepID=UPI000EF7672F|nr:MULTISPECIES: tripartite tricarboxylate transporter TctB family protein [Halostella]NHN48087.1 tripartite tricarboxylate transporter TctB family protein [Halostella sp. JP-L12]
MPDIPKQLSYDVFGRTITVKIGELVLPIIAIIASALYYIDTRGLPDQSLIYAEPVLYVTVFLAVITIVQHAISFGEDEEMMTDGAGEVDVADSVTDRPAEEELFEENEETDSPYFNRKTSTIFVVLTTGYVVALNTLFMSNLVFMGLSAVFLAATLVLFGERRWTRIVAYSAGFAVIVWAVFVSWLKIPLS